MVFARIMVSLSMLVWIVGCCVGEEPPGENLHEDVTRRDENVTEEGGQDKERSEGAKVKHTRHLIEKMLQLPRWQLRLGHPALEAIDGLHDGEGLLRIVSQNWDVCETAEKRERLLKFAMDIARMQSDSTRCHYLLANKDAARAHVEALQDESFDIRAWSCQRLMEFQDPVLQSFAEEILSAVARTKNADAALLLGRLNDEAATELLVQEEWFTEYAKRDTKLALARLGDKDLQDEFIEEFLSAEDPEDKKRLARELAYIGTKKCCKAIASQLQTSEQVRRGPLWLFLADALSMAYPDALVFQRASPTSLRPRPTDRWRKEVQKWAEKKFGIALAEPEP